MVFIRRLIDNGTQNVKNETELRRIKVLNLTAGIALFHAIFFLVYYLMTENNENEKIVSLSLEFIFFLSIFWLQKKESFKTARLSFMVVVFLMLLYHCNYAFKGYYAEYQYFVVPLFSLFLFDKYYLHYSLLVLSIAAFYLPNLVFHIYPEPYFGYLNALLLFVGIFLIVDFFKRTSERNELALLRKLKENLSLQKNLDEKNKQLQSLNAFQNHFFVNVAHEMNTPVTLLKGQTYKLMRESTECQFNDIVSKITMQVNKLEVLTNGVLDIAKLDSETLVLNKEIVSVNKLIQNVFLEFQPTYENNGVKLNVQLNKTDCFSIIDQVYFERVLGNLLANALKYCKRQEAVELKVNKESEKIIVEVSDDGMGVPPEDLELIFERFYQSKNEINKVSGSGIGLSFAKEIIELHHGTIDAYNNEKGGLTVEIILNAELQLPSAIPINKETSGLKPLLSKNILVVDDNLEMLEYLEEILQGYNVITANNGIEAMEIIEKEPIDALITDYMMPLMDGRRLVYELKKNNYRIPIIVITARIDVASKLDMLTLGVDDYLNKPFIEEELLLRLKNILINDTIRKEEQLGKSDGSIETNKINNLSKCKKLVERNLSNSYYGVAQLAEDMKVSERTLYRAIKKETGLTPNQFIREIKLFNVRKRVESGTASSLNELALTVGLTNGTYLNQLYKERFGLYIELG